MPAWMQQLVRGYASRVRRAEVAWEDMNARRAWIDAFRARSLGPTDVQLQFMRSAGHGGQNVNKVNTKVRAKFMLGEHALPAALDQALATGSPLYTPSTHALQVASDRFRSQRQNVEDALQKVHAEILRVAAQGLKGETAPEQSQRVARLENAHRTRVKQEKQMRSMTKRSRRARP